MSTIRAEIQKFDPSARVELYVLDATVIGDATPYRFHAGVNGLGNNVVWQGNTYTAFPIQASGFEWSGRGTLPTPKLLASDASGAIGALCRQFADLVGAKVTRKRTLAKYLDAVNFPGGVNATADPTAEFPDDVYTVFRKARERPRQFVEFELSPAFNVQGVRLPRRQVLANICSWRYRSAECGYTGGPVAKADDTATADPQLDVCGLRLTSCKLRFGATAELPFGGFPSAGLNR